METKTDLVDETKKRKNTDWKNPSNIEKFLKVLSVPVRRIDIIRQLQLEFPTFKDGMLNVLFNRLTPIIGSMKTSHGLYFVKDTKTALELYILHTSEEEAEEKVVASVKESENEELKVIVDGSKRGARPGYRKETWRNLMVIIDIIISSGGLIRIDELINKYKKQTKQVSFNLSKLDQYSEIMEELGVGFDYSHSKRVALKVPNCKLLIASKYNEAKGGLGTSDDLSKIKKIDSLSKALNILSPELRKATVINIAKIMYFTKNIQGVKFSDIPAIYKRNYFKDISIELVMGAVSELRQKLDENEFRFYSGSAKVLTWDAILRAYNPQELFIRMSIYEPTGTIDMMKDFGSTSSVKQVDKYVYEVSAVNDEKLTRTLMKLLMIGGRIYYPSSVEDRVREIIKSRIENTDIMIS